MKNKSILALTFGLALSLLTSCVDIKLPTPIGGNEGGGGTPDPYIPPGEMWDSSQDSLRTGDKILDLYNLNDFHGATEFVESSGEPGIYKLSSLLKSKKSANSNGYLFTSSGDMWQGSADSNLTKGKLVIDWMSENGCAAQALGNHEFDWTIDQIKENNAYSKFELISCNIINKNTNKTVDWVKPYTTATRNGVHIGIIGSIAKGITSSILASNVKDVEFVDPNNYIQTQADVLREKGADIVILLHHGEVSDIKSETASKLNAIFGGHSHKKNQEIINGCPAIQAYSNGKNLGYIQLKYNFDSKKCTYNTFDLPETFSACSAFSDDANTVEIYNKYKPQLDSIKNQVVSSYTSGISSYDIPTVYMNYAYKYFQDSGISIGGNSISFVWTNQARSEIPASSGGITYGQIYKALPFDNALCLMKMTKSEFSNAHFSNYGYYWNPQTGYTDTWNSVKSRAGSLDTVYFLVIDYIAENTRYNIPESCFEHVYREDGGMPRNIVKKYISGYPSNVRGI